MREKIKRLLSLLLALVMIAGTLMTDSGFAVTAYAASLGENQPVNTKNIVVSLNNLQKIGDVAYGNVTGILTSKTTQGTLQGIYSEQQNTLTFENVKYDQYTLSIAMDNYTVVGSQDIEVTENTDPNCSAEEANFTLSSTYTLQSIAYDMQPVTVGESKTYSITGTGSHPEVWLTCNSTDNNVATASIESNNLVVRTNKSGTATIAVQNKANAENKQEISITVNKKEVEITPKEEITVLMWGEKVSLPGLFTVSDPDAAASVVYKVDGAVASNGEWTFGDTTPHIITAEIGADNEMYEAVSGEKEYQPKKRNVVIKEFKAEPQVSNWGDTITVSAKLEDKNNKDKPIKGNAESEIKYFVKGGEEPDIKYTPLLGNKWIPPMGKEYILKASFQENSWYYAAEDDTIPYNPNKHEQKFTIKDEKQNIIDNVEFTYGDVGKSFFLGDEEPVNVGDKENPAASTSYFVKSDNENIARVKIDESNNKITITPVNAGATDIVITQEENDYYNSREQRITVKVNQYELKLSAVAFDSSDKFDPYDKTDYDNQKIFNDYNDVTVRLTVDKENLPESIKNNEDIPKSLHIEKYELSKDGQEVKDVKRSKEEVISWENLVITYKDVEENMFETLPKNYKLQEGGKISSGTLKIEPATLTLHINNAERSLRATELDFEKNKDFPNGEKIRATGFWHEGVPDSNEMEGFSLPDIVYPEVTTDLPQFSAIGKHEEVLYAKKGDKDNATNNYEFDYEKQDRGTINITAEDIAKIGFTKYLSVNNGNSINAYQPESEASLIYFGKDATVKYNISDSDKIYTKLYEVEKDSSKDVTIDGSSIGESEFSYPSVTKWYRLTNEGGDIYSDKFAITYTRDSGSPIANITIKENTASLTGFFEGITFGAYDKEQLKATVKVEDIFKIEDYSDNNNQAISGVKAWEYAVVKADNDNTYNVKDFSDIANLKFSEGNGIEGGTVPVAIADKKEVGNYIVFVKVYDQVGNCDVYGSNGAVLEDIPLSKTTVEFDDETAKTGIPSGELSYFNSQVGLDITVKENLKSVYSGVQSLSYTATVEKDEKKPVILYQEEETPVETLESLKEKYGCIEKHITAGTKAENDITIEDNTSKIIRVEANAKDFAGNTQKITGSKKFVIDSLAPVIKNSISSEAEPKNGKYYNKNVVITTEITERFLDIYNDVTYTISIDNGVPEEITLKDLIEKKDSYGILSIKITHDAEERTDKSVSTITITFAADHEYTVTSSVVDEAGNPGEDLNEHNFVVDQTNPEATITYYPFAKSGSGSEFTDAQKRVYLNDQYNSFDAIVSVKELNFADIHGNVDAQLKISAKDSANKNILADVISPFMENSKKKENWSDQGENVRWFRMNMTNDANYTFDFSYTDLAGNPLKITVPTGRVTLDRVAPTGSVTVDGLVNSDSSVKTWISQFFNKITFGLFGKNGMGATMTSEDITAGVVSDKYFIAANGYTKEQLDSLNNSQWKDYKGRVSLQANQNAIVYQRIEDAAGNYEFYSTENLVADNQDPAPVVRITPSSPGWGKGVYSAGDHPGFDITVEDPVNNNSYSGLKTITYTIKNGTTGAVETGTLANIGRNEHRQSWKGHINIDPSKFYSNDVQVVVEASDWSTNEAVSETAKLKVDNKAPVVTFAFDKSDAKNTKYYKNNKTLTITVDERNFDTTYIPKVTSTAGGGYSFSGWSTSGEKTTGVITFSGDSDYTVTYDCYDLAGNKSNTENLEEFTVDKTIPTISVSYDNDSARNGSYYKASRTATITINEHNFNAGDVKVTTTASDGRTPGVSGWSGSGDRHTATVEFDSDADYTLDISYVDMAGNNAADYDQDRFTVDLTKPELKITGVQDKSANKGTVEPVISVSDTNYIASGVTLSLKGANRGKVDTSNMISRTNAENGQIITFRNFGPDMDDIYTLTAKSVDKAGNETVQSITFSVNRNGSAYSVNDSTKELLEKGFTNNPQDIVIEEVNVDTLEFIEISYSKDGKIVKLTEGKDYKVEAEGGKGQWKKYTYTIFASCFNEEGEYSINISSTDRAENISNNKVQSMDVDFVVDMTAPIMAVSNLENRGRYKENRHEYILNVKDNTKLVTVQVYLDDKLYKTYRMENGKLVNTEDPSEVLEMENGKVYLAIDSKNSYQKIKLVSTDAAGNVSETEDYNVLVTSSNMVQFYMNKPLFYGSIIGVIAVCGAIIFMILKKKKSEEGK